MKRLYGLFAIIILSLYFAACGQPAGTIGGSLFDELMAVPHRLTYNVHDTFSRSDDLSVFAVTRGNVQSVHIESVQIGIDNNPGPFAGDGEIDIVPPAGEGFYPFTRPGRRLVILTYGDLTETYSIEVRDPLGIGNGGNGNGNGDDGTGIDIRWAPYIRILTQPAAITHVTTGNINHSISVLATVTENETLSYQWFSNTSNSNSGGIPIIDGTGVSEDFTIPTNLTEGDYYYYVEVSAPGANSVRSRTAWVNITAP